jgi:hypothetical protein
VTGTLVQPLVTLSTTEAGLSQPDLVSYLLFGVPSGELAMGARGGTIEQPGLGQDLGAGIGTYVSGTIASQLGSAFAQGIGVDYFAISQRDIVGLGDVATNFFNTAQLEIGNYIGDDVFVVLIVSRPNEQSPRSVTNFFRGVRVELALTDEWFVEGFIEDRFLRAASALEQTGLEGERIIGALIFRDWGYGSRDRQD